MKIAITASNMTMESAFESRFGRCQCFIIIDSETKNWQALSNPAMNASGGAGTQAAQLIANQGVRTVISGRYGPNAFDVLQAAGIQMLIASSGSVNDVFEAYSSGQLKEATEAAAPGHKNRR